MQSKLKNAGVLIGFALACLIAWRLNSGGGAIEGSRAQAIGVLSGYLFGASVALWGIAYQKHIARTRPAAVWQAYSVAFLVKFLGVGVGPLLVVLLPGLAEVFDWGYFVMAYGGAAVIALVFGSPEVARALKSPESDSQSGSQSGPSGPERTHRAAESSGGPVNLESRTCN